MGAECRLPAVARRDGSAPPDGRRPAPRPGAPADGVGLCATCAHARVQRSARGSTFFRCALAEDDPAFARYPALPVRACTGYRPDASDC